MKVDRSRSKANTGEACHTKNIVKHSNTSPGIRKFLKEPQQKVESSREEAQE